MKIKNNKEAREIYEKINKLIESIQFDQICNENIDLIIHKHQSANNYLKSPIFKIMEKNGK